ncbi:hypothetical protein [Nannocystis pusilla]|uniref:hypothetical protein n=1 Tax=Nannocystis pusilla TaxID=889268 RepID=UPI003B82174F
MLGRRLPAGAEVELAVVAIVGFVDVGQDDPKVIFSDSPLTRAQRGGIELFFRVYALGKRALAAARGLSGATRFDGWRAG